MEVFRFVTVFLLLQICGNVMCIQTYYLDQQCSKTISIDNKEQIRIKSTAWGNYARSVGACKVTISSNILDRMMINFKGLDIENGTDGECSNDFLIIYDGPYLNWKPNKASTIGKSKFCGETTPSTIYESSDDYITLVFHSDSSVERSGFDIIITQYHEGYCYTWETSCSNGKCIDDILACNGNNPCGDESDCVSRHIGGIHLAMIIGATVGGVALVVVAISVGVCIYCAKRRNVGRAGYMANGTQMATTTTSANMTTNFGSPYGPPPAYNPNTYGMGVVGQPQPQQPYPVQTTTTTQNYP